MKTLAWLVGAALPGGVAGCGGDTVNTTMVEEVLPCEASVVVACVCEDEQLGQQHCVEGVLGACDCPPPIPPGQCRTDLDCSDGDFCNGVERCMRGDMGADESGCMPSTLSPSCDDDIACTTDRCSSVMNRCEHVAPDADEDGHADATCLGADQMPLGDDCDDGDPARFPGNTEVCDLAMATHDEDCDATTYGARDRDGDGSDDSRCCNGDNCGGDCDDSLIARRSGQPEFCDNRDNDCDGNTDEETGGVDWYVDLDGDGFGALGSGTPSNNCTPQPTRSLLNTDCDDGDPSRHPAQLEVCDLRDQNCNLIADDNARCPYPSFPVDQLPDAGVDVPLPDGGVTCGMFAYPDVDGDGYGDSTAAVAISGEGTDCGVPTDHVMVGGDCNDNNANQNPGVGRVDSCNLIDDDCDGVVDQALEADESCALPNTARTCVNGGCVITSGNGCPNSNYQDCDQNADNGCETDLRVSPNNCGACGTACNLGDGCGNSQCLNAPITELAGGEDFSLALRAGRIVGWGLSTSQQLGVNTDNVVPMVVNGLRGVTQIDAGAAHACARSGGAIHCWGTASGGLGNGTNAPSSAPLRVTGIDDATKVYAGVHMSCAIRSDRTVWCWGSGGNGQLGNGGNGSSPTPAQVTGISDAIDVNGGAEFACALHVGGTVSCWGLTNSGRLGSSPGGANSLVPIEVPGVTSAVKLARGGNGNAFMCAVVDDGSVYCWGYGAEGQLGIGNGASSTNTPSVMIGVSQVVEVGLGISHSCVRTQAGAIYCTGNNGFIQTGQASGSGYFTPVQVTLPMGRTARSLSCGHNHACAVLDDNSVACWGSNTSRQLARPGASGPAGLTIGLP